MQCFGVDLCQDCFWAQRSAGRHLLAHPMQEYCQSVSLPWGGTCNCMACDVSGPGNCCLGVFSVHVCVHVPARMYVCAYVCVLHCDKLSYPCMPCICLSSSFSHPVTLSCGPLQPKLTQDIKDFFKVLGRRMTRPSRPTPTQAPPPTESPPVTNHRGMHIRMETCSVVSVSTASLPQAPVAVDDDLDVLIRQLEEENR